MATNSMLLKWLPFSIGFLVGGGLIVFRNSYSFSTMYEPYKICFDCGKTAGFPFIMYNSGYFWGGEGYIASGVFANSVVAVFSASVLGYVVNWLAKPRRRSLK